MHVHMAGAVFMIVLPDQALPGLGTPLSRTETR
jgi:hypothetical protein